jgi:lipopolysaccharide/colanic/teichoic acid biosynthesis glycosyltransferase
MFQRLLDCQSMGVSVIPMVTLYAALTGRVPVEHVRNEWMLPNALGGGQQSLGYRTFVRLVDWTFCLLIGLALAPLGPLIALAIKLESPGPVLYWQMRAGQAGSPFWLVKFRSMVVGAEVDTGAQWAAESDPRTTRVGWFLRRTRLDELPQVWNVLRGEMHLIGPRPERPEFVAQLEEAIPFYRSRLVVKPGLTGWAQVNYRYGNTVEDARVKLEYDLFYAKNRSVWLDLQILARTAVTMVMFRGT